MVSMLRKSVALTALGCLIGGANGARAQLVLDHFICAKIKDSVPKASYTTHLVPAHQNDLVGCVVRVPPKIACQRTAKTNVTPTPPGGGPTGAANPDKLLCYKVKCPAAANNFNTAQDQFGTHNFVLGSAKLLCAPASPSGAFLDASEDF